MGSEIRAVIVCPHCAESIVFVYPLENVRSTKPIVVPPSAAPQPKAKFKVCGCGHDLNWHDAGGPCKYGMNSPFGRCTCDKYHSRRRKPRPDSNGAEAPTSPAPQGPLREIDRAILQALSQIGSATRTQLGIITGYSHRSGSFASSLARLRKDDLVGDLGYGKMAVTSRGAVMTASVKPLPTGKDAIGYWAEKLGSIAGALLQTIASAYPEELSRAELGSRTGYSTTSGSFAAALAKLRTMGLVEGMRASAFLMQEGRGT